MMSAKQGEATATFMTVANELYGNKIPELVDEIIREMKGMVTTATSPTTITQAKKNKDKIILDAENTHHLILEKINELFDDPVFMVSFMKEVLSGEYKFGPNSDASSTHMLYITHKPILIDLENDNGHIEDMARNIDVRIDFKSVRKEGKDFNSYRYWSVLQLINKSLIGESMSEEGSFFSGIYSYLLSLLSDLKMKLSNWVSIFDFLSIEPVITIKKK
jgi:hypothetical protein